jgi:hypothetical protein
MTLQHHAGGLAGPCCTAPDVPSVPCRALWDLATPPAPVDWSHPGLLDLDPDLCLQEPCHRRPVPGEVLAAEVAAWEPLLQHWSSSWREALSGQVGLGA